MQRFKSQLFTFLAGLCIVNMVGWSSFALAADPPKPPAEDEKKTNYAKEKGLTARDGTVYKRVLKEQYEEPKTVPKSEPVSAQAKKEASTESEGKDKPKEEKEAKPAKEEKKDEGQAKPSKEEKKKDDKKDDGQGAPKKVEVPVSALYDPKVIKLDANNRPFTPVIQSNSLADYFLCNKTVSTKYQEIIINEINTFADKMALPRAQPMPCMVKISKPGTKFPGAVFVEFYVDDQAATSCIRLNNCVSARLLMLYPKDKNKKAKTTQEIYRSYVLTDERKFKRSSFCVSPEGQLLGEKNCYVALNPDWLFN
jgi:hypothetical protein